MTTSFAIFFLSTGRCGTQWIAAALAEVYADLIDVEHEPLHDRYEPRRRLADRGDRSAPLPEPVRTHCEQISQRLAARSYVESGQPCWSAIPQLTARFPGRARVVHLTRHPVPTCCSWLTHSAYQAAVLPHLTEKILLSPFDAGVCFPEYQSRWPQMNAFERCLYYWSEVHGFALELEAAGSTPWLRLSFEQLLFDGDGVQRLLAFLDLPLRPEITALRDRAVDQYRYLAGEWHDWRVIHSHPRAVAIAQELGYQLDGVDERQLRLRYLGGFA